MHLVFSPIPCILLSLLLCTPFVTMQHEMITILAPYGKYHRMVRQGCHFKISFAVQVFKKNAARHWLIELRLQNIAISPTGAYFETRSLCDVGSREARTLKNGVFEFLNERSFMQFPNGSIDTVRWFTDSRKQTEVLVLPGKRIAHVKAQIDQVLENSSHPLRDLSMKVIGFDKAGINYMGSGAAFDNPKATAENEIQGLLPTKINAAKAVEEVVLSGGAVERMSLLVGELMVCRQIVAWK